LDFADVTSIMKDAGYAHMGVGTGSGKSKAEDAARMAIQSPLLESSINGAMGVLVNVTSSTDLSMEDVDIALSMVSDAAHPRANIIIGTVYDEEMQDCMRLTVIATGFDQTAPTTVSFEDGMYSQAAAAAKEKKSQPTPHFDAPPPIVTQPPVAPIPTTPQDDLLTPVRVEKQKETVVEFKTHPVDIKKPADDEADDFIKDIVNLFGKGNKK
jgi:cell division protein FtsZ